MNVRGDSSGSPFKSYFIKIKMFYYSNCYLWITTKLSHLMDFRDNDVLVKSPSIEYNKTRWTSYRANTMILLGKVIIFMSNSRFDKIHFRMTK